MYAFVAPSDGAVTLTMQNQIQPSLPPGEFILLNERGSTFLFSQVVGTGQATSTVAIPAGLYYLVAAVAWTTIAPGPYFLDLQFQAQSIPSLPLTGTQTHTLSPSPTLLRVQLPSAGRFRLTMRGGTLDSHVRLYSARLGPILDVDDASTSSALDAGLNALLPAGTYYLDCATFRNSGPVTFTTQFTAQPVTTLACNATLTATIPGGQEDLDTYRITLSGSQDLQVALTPHGTLSPIGDPYLQIFDREMSLVMAADDDHGLVSSFFGGTLPAGTYYVTSSGYWGRGDYALSLTCGQPVTTQVALGTSVRGTISTPDGYASYVVDVQSPIGAEVHVIEATLPDAQLAILDAATGLLVGYSDDALISSAGAQVDARLVTGRYHAIVREYLGRTGSYDLVIRAPLFRDAKTSRLRGLARDREFALLVVSTATIPGVPIAPFGGFLEVDPTQGFVALALAVPTDGLVDYGFVFPPNTGAALQALHLDPTTLGGAFTNVLR